jgi:tetratricopeptide (TPR) repeat protein/tRNA A-37 threonylcarbamoyl transferase component Bud32
LRGLVENECPKCRTKNPPESKFCIECATPLPGIKEAVPTKTLETPVEELTTGSIFAGRYQIIEELGKGGMGRVYKVLDKETNERIALKLIKPEIASDKKTIERFRNELTTARKVVQKNVCRMYDLNKEQNSYYITMEYVSGGDLKRFIRRAKRLDIGTAVSIAKQICDGLDEAHSLGIIHRDLKPNNIMIDDNGNARIMDFGIARTIKEKGITGSGVMIGTPEYMSPEQVEAKHIDQRSDIYSLGIIIFEMLTGRLPFEADTPFAVGVKHKSEIPKSPKGYNSQISDDLNRVILKCLEKDKGNRYQSANELRSELEKIEQGFPTTDRVFPRKKPLTSREITVQVSLKKLFIPALIILAVAVVAILILKILPKKEVIPTPSSDKPSLAVVYFENNTGDESLDHWGKALCELLIADLTQSKYIRVLSSDRLIDILDSLEKLESTSLSSSMLKQIAVRGGSTHILRGSYTKAGEQFRIDSILQEASTMESIGSERIEGKGEESFLSMVDELTRKVKAHFELTEKDIAEDIDDDVRMITTSSPEALKYYIEGRKYHLTREYELSIELMEKSLSIDPEFAMAFRSLAQSYGGLGYMPQEKENMEKALEFSERLPKKERYLIEGDFYGMSERTLDQSIKAYKQLLSLYPDDPTGNHNLAVRYSAIGEKREAAEHYEINRKNDNLSLLGYGNLASVYRQVNSYDKAREILEESIKKYPDSAASHQYLARHYQMEGKYDLALSEISEAFSLEPKAGTTTHRQNFNMRGDIYFYAGDLDKAAEDYRHLLSQKQPQAIYLGSLGLVDLNILQGKFRGTKEILRPLINAAIKEGVYWPVADIYQKFAYINLRTDDLPEALKDCENAVDYALKAEDPGKHRQALHLKGLTYLQMNALQNAKKTAEELRVLALNSHNPQDMHYFQHLNGLIELKQKNYSKAIKDFKEALDLQTGDPRNKNAGYIESLAEAYSASGNIDSAQSEYERITASNTGRYYFGDVYAKSFFMLGKIYEQKGWKGKAIEQYDKFLELWKDADPVFTEVENAKKRLSELKIK